MNLVHRAKLLALSGVLALGGLGVVAPAVHAAPPPQLYPLGGPGQVTIEDNGGFTPGATVRLEALTPDLTRVLVTQYFTVSVCGNISTAPTLCYGPNYPRLSVNNYVGDVQIMADESASNNYLGTFGGRTHVYALSTISANAVGVLSGPGPLHPVCSVYVSGSNFQATTGQMVLVRLFDSKWNQLAWTNATAGSDGSLSATLTPQSWTRGDLGHVTADPYLVGQPATVNNVQLCPPF